MEDEIQVIKKNSTWELIDIPSDKDVIGVKQVYKVKYSADGFVPRNKARPDAKGYSQQPKIDYDETFSLVARVDTVRAIISLAGPESAEMEVPVENLDVFKSPDENLEGADERQKATYMEHEDSIHTIK
ncbi:retrovirus-related pol polyprotein from transposon TNT 1-94 [Tanacetum coccineum]